MSLNSSGPLVQIVELLRRPRSAEFRLPLGQQRTVKPALYQLIKIIPTKGGRNALCINFCSSAQWLSDEKPCPLVNLVLIAAIA